MPLGGPGKYGARAEAMLREVDATAVVVITVGGIAGSAFDLATRDPLVLATLPALLRKCADEIARDIGARESDKN